MKQTLMTEIRGSVDSKLSKLILVVEDMFIGSKRVLLLTYSVDLYPAIDVHSDNILERFSLKLYLDDKLLSKKFLEVNLSEKVEKSFEIDVDMNNNQIENRMFRLELDDIKNGRIDPAIINEMIVVTPKIQSKKFLKLNYHVERMTHYFEFSKESPDERVYMKMNNNNWTEVNESFTLDNSELEGKVNYIQLYTTDEENNKIYSNVVRFIKIDTSE